MIAFDAAHRAVHFPADRRFRIWIRPSLLIGIGAIILAVAKRNDAAGCELRVVLYNYVMHTSPDVMT